MPSDVTPLTVPACARHNGVFSKDEEYFRDFVVGASYRNPDARKIWDEKTLRALQRSPRYREMLARDVNDVEYKTRGGVFLGRVSMMTANADRIALVLRKIVTGLYFHDFGTPLGFPPMHPVQLSEPSDLDPFRPLVAAMQERHVGPVTFAFDRASDEPRGVAGVFFFFGLVAFGIISLPREPDLADPLDVSPKQSGPQLWTPDDDR